MIPQRKEDPWAHVEQRRAPAANDTRYNPLSDEESRTSKGNMPMLLAVVGGLLAFVVVVALLLLACYLAYWSAKTYVWPWIATAAWPWVAAYTNAHPWVVGVVCAALVVGPLLAVGLSRSPSVPDDLDTLPGGQ